MAVVTDFKKNSDFFKLYEAFQGINGLYTITQFNVVDNFYLWQVILATSGGSVNIVGDIDCSANPNYPAGTIGDIYRVSVAGKIGGASGFPVSVGDMIVCFVTSVTGTQAAVGANWNIKQVGLQRVFEVALATGDLTQAVVRDWTGTVGRNVSMTVTTGWTQTNGGNYSNISVGTLVISGSNFGVASNGKVTAGTASGSLTIGLGAGFVPALVGDTFVGVNAGAGITTAVNCTGFGFNALAAVTTSGYNTAFGVNSIASITNGVGECTGFGYYTLAANTSGFWNTAVGVMALRLNTSGSRNTGIGHLALENNTNTGYNTAVGAFAFRNSTNDFNTGFGYGAGEFCTTGYENVAMGFNALYNVATGNRNVALGGSAGYYETGNQKLFIDNNPRASEADGRLKALVYGIFDTSLTANQFITFNAHTLIREDLQFTTKAINVTAGDAATINSPAGRFRKDATGAAFTLTNSYITANSIIQLTPANAAVDVTGTVFTVLAGAGSAVITWIAAPTADFDMNFLVIN